MNDKENDRKEGRVERILRKVPIIDSIYNLAQKRRSYKQMTSSEEQKESRDAKAQSDSKRGMGSLLDRVLRRSSKKTSEEIRRSEIVSQESAATQKETDHIARASVDDAHQTSSMASEYIIQAKSAPLVSDVGQDTEHIVEVEEFDATDYESSDRTPETFMSTTDEIELGLAEPREPLDAEEMKVPDEVAPPPPKKVDKEDLPLITPEEAASMMDKLAALDNSAAPNASTTTSNSNIQDTLAEREATGINAVEPEALSVEDIKNSASVRPVAVDEPLEGQAKPKESHPVLDELNFAEHQSVAEINRDELISELDKLNVESASGENFSKKNIDTPPTRPLPSNPKKVFQQLYETSKKWDANIKEAQERVDKLQVEFQNAQDKLFKAEDDGAGPEKVDILQKQLDKMEGRFVKAIAHLEKAQEMKVTFEQRRKLISKNNGSASAPAQPSWTSQGSASKAAKPNGDSAHNLDQEGGAKTPKSSH